MTIKKVLDLSEYEGEFIITDGLKNVLGTCISLPLSNNHIPKKGSVVDCLYAFFLNDDPAIKVVYNTKKQNYLLRKTSLCGMSYKVHGCVFDSSKYLVKVFGFTISLEYVFGIEYGNKTSFLKNGDWVSFVVDRFDVTLC